MSRPWHSRGSLGFLIAGLTTVAISAYAIGGGQDQSASAGASSAGAGKGAIVASFAALGREQSAADRALGSDVMGPRVNAAEMRTLRSSVSWRVLGAATNDLACISAKRMANASRGAFGACGPAESVLGNGLVAYSQPSPKDATLQGLTSEATEVAVLVPDGAKSVEITLSTGNRVPLTVIDNSAQALLDARPAEFSFTDRQGAVHRLPLEGGAR